MTAPSKIVADPSQAAAAPLLEVENLHVDFISRAGRTPAVRDVSFGLAPGEVLCILGESGSGKSVTLRALMRLLPQGRSEIRGQVRFQGEDVLKMPRRALNMLRGARISMIFQEPMTALDPVFTIGDQIAETVIRHTGASREKAMARALELLELVRIPSAERRLKAYPHELSGGLRQRAMIAVSLSCYPQLLLADEPTTALDATVQIQILILLKQLQQDLGMGTIFVTHDLGVAAQIADKIAVMYAGRVVEYGSAEEVLLNPSHPYARGMLASTVSGQPRDRDIAAIPGSPPDMRNLPAGCAFAPRCAFATDLCHRSEPGLTQRGAFGHVSCHHVHRLDPPAPAGASVTTL
ncbi:ABC transporter ATP-binding protein [Rhodobacteraceae bacterium 2376]|uniref:ABC transporter ATP-binding protein n=1 Tax=Rhabdonatronobacter sediminivivens TaxID=2743469 RepID=A0A7Z0I065_9RHOB|nr:ABC transporter ATP-binding protein [Rhabdonatronobacter sediminivivens]NYS25488.1 ABC transporter ATP-binding protein [Rhabdonatronobacter sediminivivens]